MDDTAEAAGVTKPLLYQHFDSKRALYLELVDSVATTMLEAIGKAVAAAGGPRQQVEGGFAAYFHLVVTHPEAFNLLFGSNVPNDPELSRAVRTVQDSIAEAIDPLIDAGLDEDHRRLLAYAMVGMAEGASHHFVATRNPVERGTEDWRRPAAWPAGWPTWPGPGCARCTRTDRPSGRAGSPGPKPDRPVGKTRPFRKLSSEVGTDSGLFGFPNPVNEVAARVVAGGVVVLSVAAIGFSSALAARPPRLRILGPGADGTATEPARPAGHAGGGPPAGPAPRLVAGPPKRFAQAIGVAFSSTALILWFGFGERTRPRGSSSGCSPPPPWPSRPSGSASAVGSSAALMRMGTHPRRCVCRLRRHQPAPSRIAPATGGRLTRARPEPRSDQPRRPASSATRPERRTAQAV
jgi:AcrR family transcriptional regulator